MIYFMVNIVLQGHDREAFSFSRKNQDTLQHLDSLLTDDLNIQCIAVQNVLYDPHIEITF